MMSSKMHPVLTVKFYNNEKCFGPGLARLLLCVNDLKSLRAAAASMEMAYSKAWRIVKQSEAALGFKLLLRTTGGRHGGGAVLTPEAETLLEKYSAYVLKLEEDGQKLFEEMFNQ
ncbi:MAG TPA: LysR family transcriptional regulator [Clostridia bacterium]|nr:LysR family transcriptional regulator [Clostridia bacterium]HOR13468.1 LysR family transcriptional regulator [Clostridia bacterium]